MGINTRLVLPPGTRAKEVADVIGVLVGCKVNPEAKYCPDVIGPRIEGAGIPGTVCTNLIVESDYSLWGWTHRYMLHNEWGVDEPSKPFGPGAVGIIASATPFHIALFKRLADAFGGKVDYADCDDRTVYDYEPEEPEVMRSFRCEGYTDEKWREMKRHLYLGDPLTYEEVVEARGVAAYHEDDVMPDPPMEEDDAEFLTNLSYQLNGKDSNRLRRIAGSL